MTESTFYLVGGDHPETLASGRRVEPGEQLPAAAVNLEDPVDQRLLADGVLTDPQRGPEPTLQDLTRDELDARATAVGVEDPDKLPNKDAVIAAIQEKENQS